MVSAGDFRNGVTFEMDGQVYQIIEFQHVKPGKGAAFVRTKIRNVIGGAVVERTFSPTDKFPTAYIERKEMEYSYEDGGLYYFMDPRPTIWCPSVRILSPRTSSSLRRTKPAASCPTRAAYSALSPRPPLPFR